MFGLDGVVWQNWRAPSNHLRRFIVHQAGCITPACAASIVPLRTSICTFSDRIGINVDYASPRLAQPRRLGLGNPILPRPSSSDGVLASCLRQKFIIFNADNAIQKMGGCRSAVGQGDTVDDVKCSFER
jgi:hypothetical protein